MPAMSRTPGHARRRVRQHDRGADPLGRAPDVQQRPQPTRVAELDSAEVDGHPLDVGFLDQGAVTCSVTTGRAARSSSPDSRTVRPRTDR
jgi:hypothetical protein